MRFPCSALCLVLVLRLPSFISTMDINTEASTIVQTKCSTTEEACLNLSMLAADIPKYLEQNLVITLNFTEGDHYLDAELSIIGRNSVHLSGKSKAQLSSITCAGNATLFFRNIGQLDISDFKFVDCSIIIRQVKNCNLKHSDFIGMTNTYGSALVINQTSIEIMESTFDTYISGTNLHQVQFLEDVDHPYSLLNIWSQMYSATVGGALLVTNSNVSVSNSQFINNSAQLGGAIFAEKYSKIVVSDSRFESNTAAGCFDDRCNGGALFIDEGCTLEINFCYFENNTSEFGGGAIALFKASFEGNQNNFSLNRANNFGGSIFAYLESTISSDRSTYIGNTAGFSGGVIYADYLSSVTVTSSHFKSNVARESSVIYGTSPTLITSMSDTSFGTEAGYGGGVLCARFRSNVYIDMSSFVENKAENDGGVIYAISHSTINIHSSKFDDNEANFGGGVAYAYYYSSISIRDSSFSDNKAGNAGGVAHVFYDSKVNVDNSSFSRNKGGYIGGAIHAFYRSMISVGSSSFEDNIASYFGGVLYANYVCNITFHNSSFSNNSVAADGGALFAYDNNTINVERCSFDNNRAGKNGGVIYASHLSNIFFKNGCQFYYNSAYEGGVVFIRDNTSYSDEGSNHFNNSAYNNGGVILINSGNVKLIRSKFTNNKAENFGGVLYTDRIIGSPAIIKGNVFHYNRATGGSGGVIAMVANDTLTMSNNTFSCNEAKTDGGVLYLEKDNRLTSNFNTFTNNSAERNGGVFCLHGGNLLTVNNSNMSFNRAGHCGGVMYSLMQTKLHILDYHTDFSGNEAVWGGAIYANESEIHICSQTFVMANNRARKCGGAVYLSTCNLMLCTGTETMLTGNLAENGGALYASEESMLQIRGVFTIRKNHAAKNGSGIHLTMSELAFIGNSSYLCDNTANVSGGGLHSVDATVIINGVVNFTNNEAENGGAISLERNARLRGTSAQRDVINFMSNRANRNGGALYVDDNSNPITCEAVITLSDSKPSLNECFFSLVQMDFTDNTAGVSGSNLFGGLLNRCVPKKGVQDEVKTKQAGLQRFLNLSNLNESSLDTISSQPVHVCFCRSGYPDCAYKPNTIHVVRGEPFSIDIITFDHVDRSVNATVDCSLESDITSFLSQDQQIQHVDEGCTKLNFNLSSLASHTLKLSARGPCHIIGTSEINVTIEVSCPPCPIGFQKDDNSCDCVCDKLPILDHTECNISTKSIIRNENFWVSYINNTNTSGYLVYPHCPFGYCLHPLIKSVSVNLNIPNGSDAQCAANRSGLLCGSCRHGLSVSLGSSECLQCPSYWPWLLVASVAAFMVSGVALVALLLVLNLTVATGTLNAIIFYANILTANRSVFFQTSDETFASVVISWLNFDIGINVCFFDGMDTYIKTWLQLAFPTYIILLVALTIRLSNCSSKFGHLIGRKDPVATLATLILLSYTKFLQTIITAFSKATLDYPDNSTKHLWLPDATVPYITSKHAILFTLSVLILIIGLAYTLLLFTWQWIQCCPQKRMKWIRTQKLSTFMETYLIPFTSKHRYWSGLLLIVRVIMYLVSAFNPSNDPRITLSSTIFILSCLFFYKAIFNIRIYKSWFINAMETFTYFNITVLSIFTLYISDSSGNQDILTNVSFAATFILLLVVICYHICRYANHQLYLKIRKNKICMKLEKILKKLKQKSSYKGQSSQNVIEHPNELLDMVDRTTDSDDNKESGFFSNLVSSSTVRVEMPKTLEMYPSLLDSKSQSQLSQKIETEEDGKQAFGTHNNINKTEGDDNVGGVSNGPPQIKSPPGDHEMNIASNSNVENTYP